MSPVQFASVAYNDIRKGQWLIYHHNNPRRNRPLRFHCQIVGNPVNHDQSDPNRQSVLVTRPLVWAHTRAPQPVFFTVEKGRVAAFDYPAKPLKSLLAWLRHQWNRHLSFPVNRPIPTPGLRTGTTGLA